MYPSPFPTTSWGVPCAVGKIGFGNFVTLQSVDYWRYFGNWRTVFLSCVVVHKDHFRCTSVSALISIACYIHIHTIGFCQQLLLCITRTQIPTNHPSCTHSRNTYSARLHNFPPVQYRGTPRHICTKISLGAFCPPSSTTKNPMTFQKDATEKIMVI